MSKSLKVVYLVQQNNNNTGIYITYICLDYLTEEKSAMAE